MESGTVQAGEPDSNKEDKKAIKRPVDSPPMIKRKRIGGIEFRPKETDGANYDAWELVLKGKIVGFLYLRKLENINPIKLDFKRETIVLDFWKSLYSPTCSW